MLVNELFKGLYAQISINTNVRIGVIDAKTKQLIDYIERSNLVVTSGRNLIRDLLIKEPGVTGLSHLGIGTDSTAVLTTDTTLGSEVLRGALTKTISNDGYFDVFYYLSSTSGNGNTLVEAGLFNASTGGTMFARVVHDSIVKTSSIAVTYDWQINISAS